VNEQILVSLIKIKLMRDDSWPLSRSGSINVFTMIELHTGLKEWHTHCFELTWLW
jgi:hypothetical protein